MAIRGRIESCSAVFRKNQGRIGILRSRSQQIGELAKTGNRLRQPLTFKGAEQFIGRLRRVTQSFPLSLDRRTDWPRGGVEQGNQIIVRMHRLHVVARQRALREVL